jgi:hypothetical protein
MFNIRIMIHPVEILIIVFVVLSAMDLSRRYKLGKSYRELKKLNNLSYFEQKYVNECERFFKPEPWHWTALLLGSFAALNRLL